MFFSTASNSEFSLASSYNARAYLFAVSEENDLFVLSLTPLGFKYNKDCGSYHKDKYRSRWLGCFKQSL